MIEFTTEFASPLPLGLQAELERRLFFVSDRILEFDAVVDRDRVVGVRLRCDDGADAALIGDRVAAMVERELAVAGPAAPGAAAHGVKWRSKASGEARFSDQPFDALVENGSAFESALGQVAVGDSLLWLMDFFDETVVKIARDRFGAAEYRYPSLLPLRALELTGYVSAFPHLAMFASRLRCDSDTYAAVAAHASGRAPTGGVLREHLAEVDYCLSPTICFHTYHQHHQTELPSDELVITAKGKAFRHEARYAAGLERLWEFTMREVVFLGDASFVAEARQSFMDEVLAVMDAVGLSGRCEVASDLFFASRDTVAQGQLQRDLEMKYELQLDVAPGRTIAVASFNIHGPTFGEAFEIRRPEGRGSAFTACGAVGLERLAYAFVAQHGMDWTTWPDPVRQNYETRRAS